MRILTSLILRKLKDLDTIGRYLSAQSFTKIELDISRLVISDEFEKFIPLIAIELEDVLRDRVEYLRISKVSNKNIIDRVLSLLDYLDIDKIVLDYVKDTDTIYDIVDEASLYGVKVIWNVGPDFTMSDASELANSIVPYKLRLSIDVSSKRSIRDFVRQILGLGGYVEVIYLDNKSSETRGLPIFHPEGKINYVKIFKVLKCVNYEKDLILRYRPSFYDTYTRDLQLAESIISSVGSQVVDRGTKRLVESILREMMNL